ncbi:MAG: hypothetical protein M1816_005491 [Peltula sp. TS41687]|nr:MAG: hypothetical protein M1816_005491 [Peltula sp. TS41687]
MASETYYGAKTLYTTTSNLDVDELLAVLNLGTFGNRSYDDETAAVITSSQSFLGKGVDDVIAHHRSHRADPNDKLILVADRSDWRTQGLLSLNLDFHGHVDGFRDQASDAADGLDCVGVNKEWAEVWNWAKPPLNPAEGWFAVYSTTAAAAAATGLPPSESDDTGDGVGSSAFEDALRSLNAGIQGEKASFRQVCRRASTRAGAGGGGGGGGYQDIIAGHRAMAEQGHHDPTYFILVDRADWATDGVLLVKLGGDGEREETFRQPAELGAEVLSWIYIGLITWDKAKER